jgi:tape measure domain-containing protein
MSGKNLTFKLILDGDSKGLVAAAKQSEDVAKNLFATIEVEAEKLKTASAETASEVGRIVPDDLQKKADQAKDKLGEVSQAASELKNKSTATAAEMGGLGDNLQDAAAKANKAGFEIDSAIPGDAVQLAETLGNKFFLAAKEIEALGDKSVISAGELRAMSSAGEQGLGELNLALKAAQAELVRLQSTDGSLQDIEIAKERVLSIQDAIKEASSAFNYYEGVAINAMKGVDNATQSTINQVQRFSAVDLTGVIGEAQSATRAIESMGDGATVSAKDVERIGDIGANSINALENELLAARSAFSALEKSSEAITLEEIKNAGEKVKGLEQAVDLTKSAFSEFNVKASSAMQGVSTSTDKAAAIAKKAGSDIYSALSIKPPTVINDAIADLSRKLEDFKANSKLPAEEVARVTKITEQEIARLRNELAGVEPAAEKANSGVSSLSKGVNSTKFAVNALVGAMATLGVGLGIRELAETADSYTNLSARINIATSEGGNFTQAMAGVHQVALMTNTSLDVTAGLFTKVNDVGKQMGMAQQQSLDLVKTINMAVQTGGGSAQASEAAIVQLTQALQSGVLRGDEFNSIMEQAPGISSALAKSLGVTTGELRKMAENGELSAEKVVKALQDQSAAIEADYAKFPTTIGNALQRISTQWQILIGSMDQANGASATVAQWLVMLADNMGIVETLLNDIGSGFIWVGEQLTFIDVSVFESLKLALSSTYDAVKDVIATLVDFGKTIVDILGTSLSNVLAVLSSFTGEATAAGEQVGFFERVLQGLSITFGFIADGATAIKISVNLLAGAFFDLASAANSVMVAVTWGDVSKQFAANADVMKDKAKQYYAEADKDAIAFESKGVQRMKEAAQTQDEKNAETLAKNKEAFTELTKQNEDFTQKSKSLADERAAIDAQLNQARKDGNQSAIDSILQKSNELETREKAHATTKAKLDSDTLASAQATAEAAIKANGGVMDGVMQADLLTKGYIATIDEAGKVSVQAGESAAQAAENAKVKEEALKLAKDNVKKADEELLAYQNQAAAERILLDKQIEEAKRTGDLNALASAQASVDAINTKEAELKNNRDVRITELNNAMTGSGQVAESAYSRASAAAKLFGVDLDASLNKVSKSFSSAGVDLEGLKARLSEAGYTGQQAADVTYQAWLKWLETVKSQAEIDFAKAKLKEFGDQGQISTSQVEQGLIAVKFQAQKLPDDIDPVTESFKRLGIETKENLKLAAQQALMDFINVRDSGQATAEGIQKAYEKAAQAAAASGDTGRVAAVNALNAGRNLEVQIDSTGKASVKAMNDWAASNDQVRNSAEGIADGFRSAGQVARDEASSASDAWKEAANAAKGAITGTAGQQARTGTKTRLSYSKEEIQAQLVSFKYDEKRAEQLAQQIFSSSMIGDSQYRNASTAWLAEKGYDTLDPIGGMLGNFNYVAEQLEKYSKNAKAYTSTAALASAAPSVSTPSVSVPEAGKTIQNNITINGKTISVPVAEANQSNFNDFLSELETLKNRM